MSPLLKDQNFVLINKWTDEFNIGDIVIFKLPHPLSGTMIKRIVGLPHSKMYIDNFQLFINDQPVHENLGPTWDATAFDCRFSSIIQSEAEEFLVLGDNRCSSIDSRYFGALKRKDILGKVIMNFDIL